MPSPRPRDIPPYSISVFDTRNEQEWIAQAYREARVYWENNPEDQRNDTHREIEQFLIDTNLLDGLPPPVINEEPLILMLPSPRSKRQHTFSLKRIAAPLRSLSMSVLSIPSVETRQSFAAALSPTRRLASISQLNLQSFPFPFQPRRSKTASASVADVHSNPSGIPKSTVNSIPTPKTPRKRRGTTGSSHLYSPMKSSPLARMTSSPPTSPLKSRRIIDLPECQLLISDPETITSSDVLDDEDNIFFCQYTPRKREPAPVFNIHDPYTHLHSHNKYVPLQDPASMPWAMPEQKPIVGWTISPDPAPIRILSAPNLPSHFRTNIDTERRKTIFDSDAPRTLVLIWVGLATCLWSNLVLDSSLNRPSALLYNRFSV